MINWKNKLSSRKFWAALGSCALTLMVLLGISCPTQEQIIALIGAIGAFVAYIVGESVVDGARVKADAEKSSDKRAK